MLARIRPTLLCTLLLGLPLSQAEAQFRDPGPMLFDVPASTHALSLGNAFPLASRESDAVFYHPGRLGRATGFTASLQRYSSRGTLSGFSAATAWYGGGVAIGFQQLSYETPTDMDLSLRSSIWVPGDEANLRYEGEVGVSETALSVGYGRSLWGIQAGAVGKLVEKRYGSWKAGTAAVDLGVASTNGPLTLGLSVQNLGPDLKMAGREIELPTRLIFGASSDSKPVGPLDVSATTALTYTVDRDLEPSVGLEVGYWPINGRTFVARIGYRHRAEEFTASPFTFGGAFLGDDIVLEYAYQGFDWGEASHRFSVGWR